MPTAAASESTAAPAATFPEAGTGGGSSSSKPGGGIQTTEPSSSSAAVGEEAPVLLKEAQAQLAALYEVHDFFFSAAPGEKQAMLRSAADRVLATLEEFGEGRTARERAQVCLLRGRALDAFDKFDPLAEAALTKAVKLEPSDVTGWNALAHVFWKKGDLPAARDCLLQGVARRPNKESLRMLSMVLRQLPPTAPPAPATGATSSSSSSSSSPPQAPPSQQGGGGAVEAGGKRVPALASPASSLSPVEESVARAKAAVALDVGDPQSWYILGNAYVALFFARPGSPHAASDLGRALGAYQKAEANGGGANPDLYFNLAQVRCYREEFALAAAAFHRAADLDPALPVGGHLRAMERRVARTVELVAKRGKVKEKRLQQLAAALVQEEAAAIAAKAAKDKKAATKKKGKEEGKEGKEEAAAAAVPAVRRVVLEELKEGPNPNALLALKLVLPLGQLDHPPSSFIVLDKTGACSVLSVYHLGAEAARRLDSSDATTLHVLHPVLKTVEGPVGGGEEEGGVGVGANNTASYRAIQILDPMTLLIDGRPVDPSHLAPARVRMEAFDG